jgi:hypothetical protein
VVERAVKVAGRPVHSAELVVCDGQVGDCIARRQLKALLVGVSGGGQVA